MASLVPDMPIGWPRAMAPPFTLTMSSGTPRSSIEAACTAAKASLISNRSTSPMVEPGAARPLPGWRADGWVSSEASGPATWP